MVSRRVSSVWPAMSRIRPTRSKLELAHRLDHYNYTSELLKEKQSTLKAKRMIIKGAHDQLENLKTQKSALLAKLAKIEAKLRQIEANQAKNEFHFDGSRPGECQANDLGTGRETRRSGSQVRDGRALFRTERDGRAELSRSLS